jgi:hypothetical protein
MPLTVVTPRQRAEVVTEKRDDERRCVATPRVLDALCDRIGLIFVRKETTQRTQKIVDIDFRPL